MTGTYTFFAFPDLNARIGLALDGDTLAVAFLSEGSSRSGKPGSFRYSRRNPDRRKAFCRLLEHRLFQPHTARGGKAANPPEPVTPTRLAGPGGLLQAFRAGGNYRFDCWACVPGERTVADLAAVLGLQPTKNRPVAVRWLGNPSHDNNPQHTIGGVK